MTKPAKDPDALDEFEKYMPEILVRETRKKKLVEGAVEDEGTSKRIIRRSADLPGTKTKYSVTRGK